MYEQVAVLLIVTAIIGSPPLSYRGEYIAEAQVIEQVNIAPRAPVSPVGASKSEILSKIAHYANKHGVSADVMESVVEGESGFRVCAVGDAGKSFGLAQIFLPSHPGITKEMACDPDFALNFLASNLAAGKGKLWTVYRKLYM